MGLQVPGVDPREGVVVYAGNCLPYGTWGSREDLCSAASAGGG